MHGSPIAPDLQAFVIFASMVLVLSGCTLNVNLNVSTDKPIALNVAVDKPIDVKLGADVAITKLPPIQTDSRVGFSTPPPKKAGPAR